MEILQELIQIIKKRKLGSIELLGSYVDQKSKVNLFYEALLEGKFNTDNDASNHFYKGDSNNPSYKGLKANLKKRLINAIFFLNLKQPLYNDYEQSYYYCCKYMAAAKILIRLQAKEAGINLCLKVFKKARDNEFTHFIFDSSNFLRGYFGTRKGNLEKFNYYNEILLQAEQDWIAENRAYEYYIRLMLPYIKEKSSKNETHIRAREFGEKLRPYMENSNSPYLHFLGSYIEVISYMSVNDYASTIEICNKAIRFFEKKPYVYKTAMNVFLHNKLACHTQLRQYDEGKAIEEKTLKLLQVGTYNWYRDRELFFVLSMHTKNYQAAYDIYVMAKDHQRFRFLSPTIKEAWLVYESYLHFLVNIEELEPNENDKRFNVFKLGKFINSIPVFSKDKRGFNIPILIIQILFLIVRKDYDKSIDRIEAIEKYCFRYLRKEYHMRSNTFIKMLLLIPKCNFHKAAVERKGKTYISKLKSNPLDIANQVHEIEIIPYEQLWDFILESLESKFFKSRKKKDMMGRPKN